MGALILVVPQGPVSAGELTVQMSAAQHDILLGSPFRFSVHIKNPTAGTLWVGMSLDLMRARNESSVVPFTRWISVVTPGDTSSVRLSVITSQWFATPGRYRIKTSSDTPQGSIDFTVKPASITVPRFTDVTHATGLGTVHQASAVANDCNWAAGAAWGDVDADADLDLYLPNQTSPGQLWINVDGHFSEQASERGVNNLGYKGIGAVFVDYDRDRDQDLYVTNDGPNRLFRNDGSGHFTDVAPEAGVADSGPSTSAAWGDYDGDGNLDLYVADYGRCAGADVQKKLVYSEDKLYRNEGNGTFTDRTALLGPATATMGAGFQAAWLDYDHDGDQDLYLANDFVGPGPRPNVLWRNDGSDGAGGWRFTEVSIESGAGLSINTMGVGIGDYDRDGHFDLALSNIEASVLLHNRGNGSFEDVATFAGVARPQQRVFERSVTWGMGFFDFNLDGWEDLYAAAGAIGYEANPESQPNALFVNRRNGRFLDLSAPSRADDPTMTRGVAFADYDRDGRVDLYIVNRAGIPRLLRNVTPRRDKHWLEVDTVGTLSNTDGCGTRLTARVGKARLVRAVYCGSISLASGSDPTVHFGLGRVTRVRRLTIEWPSGITQVLRGVRADRRITVTEPAS